MKWIDYREALGIGFSDSKKTEMLTNKIFALFDELSDKRAYGNIDDICRKYFCEVGEKSFSGYYTCHDVQRSIVMNSDICGLISYTIAFSNSAKKLEANKLGNYILKELKTYLRDLNIDYEIISDDDGCFIFPKGASELDEANVSAPFEWLRKYPLSRKAMENALKAYSNMETPSQVADLFRKSLETFAQEFFGKSASLENLKIDFGQYLKENGVPKELASNFECTLQMYTNYMNNYAKHHDKTERRFLEFIMYQTGNIIRFVISISDT